jgi:hypothetical protein
VSSSPTVPLRYAGAELAARRLQDELENELRRTRRGRLVLTLARSLSRIQHAASA